MEDIKTLKRIASLEDVDKEIEEVKQRIKLKEAELSESFKVVPNQFFNYAVTPLSSAVSSFAGGSILLKVISVAKNFIVGVINKSDENAKENRSGTKSFILNSIKDIGLASLLKLGARLIRRI